MRRPLTTAQVVELSVEASQYSFSIIIYSFYVVSDSDLLQHFRYCFSVVAVVSLLQYMSTESKRSKKLVNFAAVGT